jgi:hypothetical protein
LNSSVAFLEAVSVLDLLIGDAAEGVIQPFAVRLDAVRTLAHHVGEARDAGTVDQRPAHGIVG